MIATVSFSVSTKHAFAVALGPATGGTTLYGSATMSGEGDLAAAGWNQERHRHPIRHRQPGRNRTRTIQKGLATLSGAGTLAAIAHATCKASATMSGTGDLAAAALVTRRAAATMSGEGHSQPPACSPGEPGPPSQGPAAWQQQPTSPRAGKATMAGTGSPGSSSANAPGAPRHPVRDRAPWRQQPRCTRRASATMAGSGSLAAAAHYIRRRPLRLRYALRDRNTYRSRRVLRHDLPPPAAQRNPHRKPYLEARVYDYEQGIKRLTWTRLYDGSETDNHHGHSLRWTREHAPHS